MNHVEVGIQDLEYVYRTLYGQLCSSVALHQTLFRYFQIPTSHRVYCGVLSERCTKVAGAHVSSKYCVAVGATIRGTGNPQLLLI